MAGAEEEEPLVELVNGEPLSRNALIAARQRYAARLAVEDAERAARGLPPEQRGLWPLLVGLVQLFGLLALVWLAWHGLLLLGLLLLGWLAG